MMNERMQEKADNEILFSKMVKAGKRIYYIDVKRDRRGEYYMALTESKRVKDGTETARPVFEKHKIFLYREDVAKFSEAFREVTDYVLQQDAPAQAGAESPAQTPAPAEDGLPETEGCDVSLHTEF